MAQLEQVKTALPITREILELISDSVDAWFTITQYFGGFGGSTDQTVRLGFMGFKSNPSAANDLPGAGEANQG